VALFSDVDWIIILAAAVFLLLGKDSGQMLRTMGRWYGRLGRIKEELLGEFAKAAELPLPPPGTPLTVRGALLGLDPTPTQRPGIPAAVRLPPGPPPTPIPPPVPTSPWTGGAPVPTWSMTTPVAPSEWEVSR
jgi:hypothetical protein